MRRQTYILFFLVALIVLICGMYLGVRHFMPSVPDKQAIVAQLLTQTWPNKAGKPESLAQWKGHPLVINFWASWCAPCVEEMPELTTLHNQLSPKGMYVLGVGVDSVANVTDFAKRYNISFPVYAAGIEGIDYSRLLGNNSMGLPLTILVDKEGKIIKTYVGRLKITQLQADISSLGQ